jgi:hypothetical protein
VHLLGLGRQPAEAVQGALSALDEASPTPSGTRAAAHWQTPLPLQLLLQQSALAKHVCMAGLQHLCGTPPQAMLPPQQSLVTLHALPRIEQPQVPVPPLHTPVQQSVETEHGLESKMHPHLPVEVHSGFGEQQSAVRLQAVPTPTQPHVEVNASQTWLQHWLSIVHDWPSLRHTGTGG